MGDEKYYTIQIKGTAYRFQPLPAEDVELVVLVMNMNATPAKTFNALTRVLATSAGPEQWDAITDRLIQREVTVQDITVAVFEKLMKRQGKDQASAPDAG